MDNILDSFYNDEILKKGKIFHDNGDIEDDIDADDDDDYDFNNYDDDVHEVVNLNDDDNDDNDNDEDDVDTGFDFAQEDVVDNEFNDVPTPSTPKTSDVIPCIGRTFNSLNDAEVFYRNYAQLIGFEVRIKCRRKSLVTKDWCSCLFQCRRARKANSSNSDEDTNIGGSVKGKGIAKLLRKRDPLGGSNCKARLFVSLNKKTNMWVVTRFEATHNHPMVSPSKKHFLSTRRHVTPVARQLIDVCRRSNIGASKIMQIFQQQSGGLENVGMSLKDIENTIRDMRKAEFDPHDAEAAINYLKKQHEDSGGSMFFKPLFDDDNRIKCLVWVDGRSRHAYKVFGDAVAFDTTYRTNRYRMPFAPFTGVNHHFHSILFGFALLCNEKEETFEWVFNTWLEAMDGKAPITIITDQDIAMGNAIKKVFPGTHHHLCTWHIGQKYPIKLGTLFQDKQFRHDFDRCIKKSISIHEFEERWASLVQTYSLHNHDWLNDQYKVREQWVPAYTKRFFSASMNSTQRSESMNSYFDQFVSSCTGLKDFVQKSEEALGKQFFRERKEDFDTKYYSRQLIHRSSLERHGATVYTKSIFKMFQDELSVARQLSCQKYREGCTDEYKVYTLTNGFPGAKDRRFFSVVHYLASNVYKCSCQMFESSGMICCHLIRYLEKKNTSEIPINLICKRWTIEANRYECETSYHVPNAPVDYASSQSLRYNHLCQLYMGLSLEASVTMKGYEHALLNVQQQREIVSSFPPDDVEPELGNTTFNTQMGVEVNCDTDNIVTDEAVEKPLDPEVVVTKGRRREKRLKSGIEKASMTKPLRKCKLCNKHTNHDSRNHYRVLGLTPP